MRYLFDEYGRVIIAVIVSCCVMLALYFTVGSFNTELSVFNTVTTDKKYENAKNKTGYYSGKTAAPNSTTSERSPSYIAKDGKVNKVDTREPHTSDSNEASATINWEELATPHLELYKNIKFDYDKEYDRFPYIMAAYAEYPVDNTTKNVYKGKFSKEANNDRCLAGVAKDSKGNLVPNSGFVYGPAYKQNTHEIDPNYRDSSMTAENQAKTESMNGWITYDSNGNVFSILHIYTYASSAPMSSDKWNEMDTNGKPRYTQLADKGADIMEKGSKNENRWKFKRNFVDGGTKARRQYYVNVKVSLTVNNTTVTKTSYFVVD